MMMRSEAEIRREVETRLRRRGLLMLDAGLGALTVFFLIQYSHRNSFGEPFATWIAFFMLGWFVFGLLHLAYVVYVEAREWLVRRAIEREREFYLLQTTYEKQKRDDSASRNERGSTSPYHDDGELIEFPYHDEAEDNDYAQRSRNS